MIDPVYRVVLKNEYRTGYQVQRIHFLDLTRGRGFCESGSVPGFPQRQGLYQGTHISDLDPREVCPKCLKIAIKDMNGES